MQTADYETQRGRINTLNPVILVRTRRKSVEQEIRLVTQNGLDVRVEKVKRQKRKSSDFVNGQYYPQPTQYGYRLTGLPQRTMTYFEVVELLTNWMSFMKGEQA